MPRVISGKYKGSILEGDNISGTRPTQSRVKESLFGMIQDRLEGSVVLDLFAGSGALGIEALSMGSSFSYFVEHQSKTYNVLKRNIEKLNIENARAYKGDFITFLKNTDKKFDIVFLDPPYNSCYINKSIELLIKRDLLNDNSIVVCETDNLSHINNFDTLSVCKERKYSDKYIVILEKV